MHLFAALEVQLLDDLVEGFDELHLMFHPLRQLLLIVLQLVDILLGPLNVGLSFIRLLQHIKAPLLKSV